MSTRSSITAKCKDGKFKSIYCHYDGDVLSVGKMLFEHYQDQQKIENMLALGDMSSLNISIECPDGHSFKNCIAGYTNFYGRDRGESDVDCLVEDSQKKCLKKNNQEYNYFWDGEKWFVGKNLLLSESIQSLQ